MRWERRSACSPGSPPVPWRHCTPRAAPFTVLPSTAIPPLVEADGDRLAERAVQFQVNLQCISGTDSSQHFVAAADGARTGDVQLGNQ